MRVLVIKTSSMGDIIHTLPALTDAGRALPSIRFDWAVEENFAEIPRWHSRVDRVIPLALRRWRKNLFAKTTRTEWKNFLNELRAEKYDLVIDAQGLLKSAVVTRFANGTRYGFDKNSAREGLAAMFYNQSFSVERNQHAIHRVRNLFSQSLGYALPSDTPSYGIDRNRFYDKNNTQDYLVFLHGTTWDTKHWPEKYWIQLGNIANEKGLLVKLPWGNSIEHERAKRIAEHCPRAEVLPRLDLVKIAGVLANAKAIVAVDTGLGHLAAALDVPTVSLYGPTNPVLTGALGESQIHLTRTLTCSPCLNRECALLKSYSSLNPASPLNPPCFTDLLPTDVWKSLEIFG